MIEQPKELPGFCFKKNLKKDVFLVVLVKRSYECI